MNRLAPLMAIHAEKQSTFVSRLRYWALLLLTVGLLQATTAQAQIINTLAGNGTTTYNGEDENGTDDNATAVSLSSPRKAAIDASGNVYIADSSHNRIRRVDKNGIITTVAGNGTAGFSGDGGLATSASLNYPTGVAIDSNNNLYIADNQNHRIRKVTTDGFISTVAGTGEAGYNSDNIAATTAQLNTPVSVAIDSAGTTLYIVDKNNQRIRKVTGTTITTVAGTGEAGYNGDYIEATKAFLNFPFDVAVDTSGTLFIADTTNQLIRRVTALDGLISTVAGNGGKAFTGDNGEATNASLNNPAGIAVAANGDLYIADTTNQRIRQVWGSDGIDDGIIRTVVGNGTKTFGGDGGAPINASLNNPYGITVDTLGNLYIADTNNQRVRKVVPPTTTTVTSSPNPSDYGNSIYFTATVAGNNPLGTVQIFADDYYSGSILLCTEALDNGSAKCSSDGSLAPDSYYIIAVYSGDSNNPSSTSVDSGSGYLIQIVNKATTSTTVTSSKNPSLYNEPITFTAAVTGSSFPPTGTVTFKDGSTTLCSAVKLDSAVSPAKATCTTSTLSVGSHSITATYEGDSNNTSSTTTTAVTQTVNKATTSTTVTNSPSTSEYGDPVTFTASISGGVGTSGTVTFKDNGTGFCDVLLNDDTSANCVWSALSVGTHSITATYEGDSNNASSTTTTAVTQTVKAVTTTTVTSSKNPATYGDPVTFTASVSYPSTSTYRPSGTVTFKDGDQLICKDVSVVNLSATCVLSTLSAGSHSVTATYNGDSYNMSSTSAAVTQTVKAVTTTKLLSSASVVIYGSTVTFTATIKNGSVNPTGNVTFKDNGTTFNACTSITVSNAQAICNYSGFSKGTHSITATYNGDSYNLASTSSAVSLTVNAPLAISLISPVEGEEFPTSIKVNMVASVSGGSVPIKQVDFYVNGAKIGTDTTSTYSYITSKLAIGSYTLKAKAIDTNGSSKTSDSVTIKVCYECYKKNRY